MSRGGAWRRRALGVLGLLSLCGASPVAEAAPTKASRPKAARTRTAPVKAAAPAQAPANEAAAPRPEVEVLEVVEVAGDRAYLSPGVDRQFGIDERVTIGRHAYRVLAHNTKNIVIALDGRRVTKGQRGMVQVRLRENTSFAARPAPVKLAKFARIWREPARPADSQSPKFVPLGAPGDERRNRAMFSLDHSRIMPLSGSTVAIDRARLRGILHAELGSSRFVFDADAFAELWRADDLQARRGSAARPLINVRQLELSYRGDVLQAGLGRLRYASSTLGMLDGARASASLSESWSLGAFGGTLADPLDGRPATDVVRFGGELLWQGQALAAPTRASLTLQGSRFLGATDERRVTALVEAYPKFGRLGAHAEANFFDEQNPWNAPVAELTAIGADASIKIASMRFGAALDMRRPERSLWLAAALPQGYFCVARSAAGTEGIEPCIGGDQRVAAQFTAAYEGELWSLDSGATTVATRLAAAEQTTAFLSYRQRGLWGAGRFDAGASISSGSLIESAALNLGVGASLLQDSADLSVYYRPNVLRYRADARELLEHGAGTRLWWAARSDLDLSLSADVLTGPDVDVLFLQTTLAWRPRF
jgi:hypothetical protein